MSLLSETPGCNPACGACHYKDIPYADQLARKQLWAEKQLGRICLRPIRPAPQSERLGYRAKTWLRADFGSDAVSFGMRRAIKTDLGWEKEFVAWNECPLHADPVNRLVAHLRRTFQNLPEPVRHQIESEWVGVWFGIPEMVIVSRVKAGEALPGAAPLAHWTRTVDWSQILAPPFERVWFHLNPQVGRKVFGHEPIELLAGKNYLPSGQPIRAFRQVAHTLLQEARALAVRHLLEDHTTCVVDLYCGTGELSCLLPDEVNWIGVELSSAAVQYANGLKPAIRRVHEALIGTVEHRLPDPRFQSLLARPDGRLALYLNPPRPGLGAEGQRQVLHLIESRRPARIAYLSCSASSLARDLKMLEGAGYETTHLQPYDFFPQTEHFETLALLKRHN